MGFALKAGHLDYLLYRQGAVLDQGPCHSKTFPDQKSKNGRTVDLLEAIFQFVLIGALLTGKILQGGKVLVQIVDDHVMDVPDDLDVLWRQRDLMLLDALGHFEFIFGQPRFKGFPLGKEYGVQQGFLTAPIQGLIYRYLTILGQQKTIVRNEFQEQYRFRPLPFQMF